MTFDEVDEWTSARPHVALDMLVTFRVSRRRIAPRDPMTTQPARTVAAPLVKFKSPISVASESQPVLWPGSGISGDSPLGHLMIV